MKDALDLEHADGKTYNIEFTSGEPTDSNATMFFNGAVSVLKPYLNSGVLVVSSGQTEFQQVAIKNWDSTLALERMQNILASHYAGDNKVIITGQDGDVANLANIIDGKHPDGSLIDNSNWPFSCIFDTETYDNGRGIVASYLLTPTVITKEYPEVKALDNVTLQARRVTNIAAISFTTERPAGFTVSMTVRGSE